MRAGWRGAAGRGGQHGTGWQHKMATTTAHNLGRIHYLVHTPPALADEGPVPLLLFLHGVGERGPPDGQYVQFFIGCHHYPLTGPM